jgi:hypothetical protein
MVPSKIQPFAEVVGLIPKLTFVEMVPSEFLSNMSKADLKAASSSGRSLSTMPALFSAVRHRSCLYSCYLQLFFKNSCVLSFNNSEIAPVMCQKCSCTDTKDVLGTVQLLIIGAIKEDQLLFIKTF